jgi:hypothetical protein
MIGLRRACAFVAVSLRTSTATAYAECAWKSSESWAFRPT